MSLSTKTRHVLRTKTKKSNRVNPESILWRWSVGSKGSLRADSSSEPDDSSQKEIEAATRALVNERVSERSVRSNKNNRLRDADRNRRFVDTVFEILAFQAYGNSSSSNTIRFRHFCCRLSAHLLEFREGLEKGRSHLNKLWRRGN